MSKKTYKTKHGKVKRLPRSSKTGKTGWQDVFIASIEKDPSVKHASLKAKVTKSTIYEERDKDPKFAQRWAEAAQAGVDELEASVFVRAKNGISRGVWRTVKGKAVKVETVYEYSDALAMFMLRAHKPGRYRETIRSEVTGAEGGPVAIATDPLVLEALNKLYGTPVQVALPPPPAIDIPTNGNGNGHT